MRVYLNTSALNRPFDDLGAPRIRDEAEAVTKLLAAIEAKRITLVTSEYLTFEVNQNPYADRVEQIRSLLRLAKVAVPAGPRVVERARALERFGLRGLDALHVASAESGEVDALVTTDDRMIKAARRAVRTLTVRVVSPLDALSDMRKGERVP